MSTSMSTLSNNEGASSSSHINSMLLESFMTLHQEAPPTCLALMHEPRKVLFAGCYDNSIHVWELTEFTRVQTLLGHQRSLIALQVIRDVLVSSAMDTTVRVWKGRKDYNQAQLGEADAHVTYDCVKIFSAVAGNVLSLGLMSLELSDDVVIFFGDQDMLIRRDTFKNLGEKEGSAAQSITTWTKQGQHSGYVYALKVFSRGSNTKNYLLSASGDGTVGVWELPGMQSVDSLVGHQGSVFDVEIARDIFTASQDTTIRCWDIDTLKCKGILQGHTESVLCLCNFSNGGRLCSGSSDRTLRIWDTQAAVCLQVIKHSCSVLSVKSEGVFVFTASSDCNVRVWDINVLNAINKRNEAADDLQPLSLKPLDVSSASGQILASDSSMIYLLKNFVGFRSVSSDPSLRQECWQAAKFLKSLLSQLGAECRFLHKSPTVNPIVLGSRIVDPKQPTILICGHYDVQPAKEEDGWDTPPFVLTGKNGYLYGRGATDDKGPIIATLLAIRQLIEHDKEDDDDDDDEEEDDQEVKWRGDKSTRSSSRRRRLPNFVFLYQGEGENRSLGYQDMIEANLAFFEEEIPPITFTFVSNNYWLGEETPCLTYGMRGFIRLQVEVEGSRNDIHSGVDGGVVQEPLHDLIALLNQFIDPVTRKCAAPGFYDAVLDVSKEELELFENIRFDVHKYKEEIGVSELRTEKDNRKESGKSDQSDVTSILTSRWTSPAISITGIETSKVDSTIIPHKAIAHISVRTVPNQKSTDLQKLLEDYLIDKFQGLHSTNRLKIEVKSNVPWWLGDINNKYYKEAERALEKHWKTKPLYVREGGTSQTTQYLQTILKAPCLHFPMGQSTDRAHLNNERIRLKNLRKGTEVLQDFFRAIASPQKET